MSNVYEWPADSVTVPAFVMGYPENIMPKMTFGRGGDEADYPVWYVVGQGQTSSKDVRDQLSLALGNAADVITVLDGVHSFGAVDTTTPHIQPVNVGTVPFIAIRFDCHVMTSGPMNMSAIMDGLATLLRTAGL
jgi:hypothetical protein